MFHARNPIVQLITRRSFCTTAAALFTVRAAPRPKWACADWYRYSKSVDMPCGAINFVFGDIERKSLYWMQGVACKRNFKRNLKIQNPICRRLGGLPLQVPAVECTVYIIIPEVSIFSPSSPGTPDIGEKIKLGAFERHTQFVWEISKRIRWLESISVSHQRKYQKRDSCSLSILRKLLRKTAIYRTWQFFVIY